MKYFYLSIFFLFLSFLPSEVFAQSFFYGTPSLIKKTSSEYIVTLTLDKAKQEPAILITDTKITTSIYKKEAVGGRGSLVVSIPEATPTPSGVYEQSLSTQTLSPNTSYILSLEIKGGGKTEKVPDTTITTPSENELTQQSLQTPNDFYRYDLLAPLPGINAILDPERCAKGEQKAGEICDLNEFINFMLTLIIAACAVILVVRLIIAGYAYMTTDVPFVKMGAKNTFFTAFAGLMVALSAYLILNTINPRLVRNSFEVEEREFKIETFEEIDGEAESIVEGKAVKITKSKIAYATQFTNKTACGGEGGTQQTPNSTTCVLYDTSIVKDSKGLYVEKTFSEKLKKFNMQLQTKNIPWKITEAWPQSRTHKATCHHIGVCIDMNHTTSWGVLSSNQNPPIEQIVEVIRIADSLGMCAQYEILRDRELYQKIAAAGYGKNVIFFNGKWISANHYSLYNGICR